VNQTVALSFNGDIAVSECGYSVFGTRTFDPVIPGSRFARPGMTFECVDAYNESGAVTASSQTLVASSTCGRTSWRTLA
jgi:hypothetical protein